MTRTISGHPAAESYSDPRLATGTVPGTAAGIKLTTMAEALPLFLHLAKRANKQVLPLSLRDTWSIGIRPPAAGSASSTSDHAGWAIDLWSARIGAHTWPPKMSAAQAKVMRRIVHSYKTPDGRRVFGWGAHVSLGGDYQYEKNNDPMHVFVRPGITDADLRDVQHAMGIGSDGRNKPKPAERRATVKRKARVWGTPYDRKTRHGKRAKGDRVRVADTKRWRNRLGRKVLWLQIGKRGRWIKAKRTDWKG